MRKSFYESISLESEVTDGKIKGEIEFVIYGKINDNAEMQRATEVIRQKQATVRGAVAGSQIRMRMAQSLNPRTLKPIGDPQYIVTAKAQSKQHEGLDEVSTPGSEDLMNVFLSVCGEYIHKVRYVIPETRIPTARAWEVDIFQDANNNPCEWMKIDLEVSDSSLKELPVLPNLDLSDVIIVRAGVYKNKEEQDFVKSLFPKYFYIKHKA